LATSPQAIVNMFHRWYRHLGFVGCSSHSWRRTFITSAARKISTVGGSLKDKNWLDTRTYGRRRGTSMLTRTLRFVSWA
jgi:hypothetical protein